MTKSTSFMCENKRANGGNGTQQLISVFVLATYVVPKSDGCTPQFVSDLVGNTVDKFSRDTAH